MIDQTKISVEAREGAMDDHDDPFKGMVDDGEDDSAVGKLEFDLNQLREDRPGLGPESLDADGLVDFDSGSGKRISTIVC